MDPETGLGEVDGKRFWEDSRQAGTYPALSEYRIHVNLSTKVLTPAPQSTSAVPSPVTTRRTST